MEKVAITGLGVVSPIGAGIEAFWSALLAGRHGFTSIESPTGSGVQRQWAAVPEEIFAAHSLPPDFLRNADRFTQFAVMAAAQALSMAGLDPPPTRTAVILGNTMGGLPLLASTQTQLADSPHRVTPKLMALIIPNMASARISLNWALKGRQLTISTACASSLDAIGIAAQMIERGEVACVIAGGVETLLAPVVYASLDRAGALSRARDPQHSSRPFDVDRDGFVMGEGGAIMVLEAHSHAERRGAQVLGRVRGYASMTDAYHLTAPESSGRFECEVMQTALTDAQCGVDTVFAHATGTVVGDITELKAINAAFHGERPRVTSLKGHLGHSMAAAGAMSAIAGVLGMARAVIPQTLGTETVEPEAQFDLIVREPRAARYGAFLVNAFGFGGQNASLVFSK